MYEQFLRLLPAPMQQYPSHFCNRAITCATVSLESSKNTPQNCAVLYTFWKLRFWKPIKNSVDKFCRNVFCETTEKLELVRSDEKMINLVHTNNCFCNFEDMLKRNYFTTQHKCKKRKKKKEKDKKLEDVCKTVFLLHLGNYIGRISPLNIPLFLAKPKKRKLFRLGRKKKGKEKGIKRNASCRGSFE